VNREALHAITLAQAQYLEANGWARQVDGTWLEPKGQGRIGRSRRLDFRHAVNSQLYRDRNWVEMPPPPTREAQIEYQYVQLRKEWAARHEPCTYKNPRRKRQDLRVRIRTLTRLLANTGIAMTRVEKCRLERATHAKHHRETGCPCGKEGPPY